MYLWHIFLIKPFAALSVVICLATILSLFLLERRRPHFSTDRFLIGFVGLLSVYQGFRILESAGLMNLSVNSQLDDAIELIVTVFYLVAALLLRLSSESRLDAESALRLAHAAPPKTPHPETAAEAPRALFPVEKLSWVLPKVSDGAFKIYTFLFLHADPAKGRVVLRDDDLKSLLGKSEEQIQAHLAELQRVSAITVLRSGSKLMIDLNGRSSMPSQGEDVPPLLSLTRG